MGNESGGLARRNEQGYAEDSKMTMRGFASGGLGWVFMAASRDKKNKKEWLVCALFSHFFTVLF